MTADDQIPNSISYNYHNYITGQTAASPVFILIYWQCANFIINAALKLNMEVWQLVFPTFVVVLMVVLGYYNSMYNS